MKRVDIIGGGIAGLALGTELQKRGVTTTIYERHSAPGGLCVNWKRGKYSFNGCVHWILGAKDGVAFYDMWRRVADIDSIEWHMPEERTYIETIDDNGQCEAFHFYTDIDRLEAYLLDMAPEDSRQIRRWTGMVRYVADRLDCMPPKVPVGWWRRVKFAFRMTSLLPVALFMVGWGRELTTSFACTFINPRLRRAVTHLYSAPTVMSAVVFAQAYATRKVAQYPIGGSAALTNKLVDEYVNAGGSLRLSTGVHSIRVKADRAFGLQLENGELTEADYVASAADWHWTMTQALGGRYITKKMQTLVDPPHEEVYYSYCRVYIGVAMTMSNVPHFARYATSSFMMGDGTKVDNLEVETYNNDPTLSPAGNTVMAVNILTREGEWWIQKRQNDISSYRAEKESVKEEVMARLTDKFGQDWRSSVEVVDVVTPATYNRYTGNLYGSSQGWSPRKILFGRHPVKQTVKKLDNFILCGHWTVPGGGLPVALITAIRAANTIIHALRR